jgi:hypothetical protein
MKPAWALLGAALAMGCGADARAGLGVLASGTDATMIGTFRLADAAGEAPGVLRTLALRNDRSFYAQLVANCDSLPCTAVDLEGGYRQIRELPNPNRASAIDLYAQYADPGSGEAVEYKRSLRRFQGVNSAQAALSYTSTDEDPTPGFVLLRSDQVWCATAEDCGQQNAVCGAECRQGLCACQ